MHLYPHVCYLDPAKTGTTFVSKWLRRHMDEPELAFKKHDPLTRDDQVEGVRGRIYFATIRNPYRQMESIWRFGHENDGGVRAAIWETHGPEYVERFYTRDEAGFARWVDFMNDYYHPTFVNAGWGHNQHQQMGILTFRFLRTVVFKSPGFLRKVWNQEAAAYMLKDRGLPRHYLLTERLSSDLYHVADHYLHPYLRDPKAALMDLERDDRVRVSEVAQALNWPKKPKKIFRDREAMLFEVWEGLTEKCTYVHEGR